MTTSNWAASLDDEGEWEPFGPPGESVGQVRWLLKPEGEHSFHAGVWKVRPDELPERAQVISKQRESIYVLEGEVHIDIQDGPSLQLTAGDMATFAAGATAFWTVVRPYREFFVYS